jgi:hypothetical protein
VPASIPTRRWRPCLSVAAGGRRRPSAVPCGAAINDTPATSLPRGETRCGAGWPRVATSERAAPTAERGGRSKTPKIHIVVPIVIGMPAAAPAVPTTTQHGAGNRR